ncbi:hypothetical protein BV20DRAFT_977504 [Pilatotrama ljubarskyi]|nr:hypothetical protein BV20DRAFT_977504 [Pilatotrama ljubarskyi]
MNGRRNLTFVARVGTLEELGLERHRVLFNRLTIGGMSGDEAEENLEPYTPRRYRIIRSRWQSHALRTFLRQLDALHFVTWQRPNARTLRWAHPRLRFEPQEPDFVDSPAPVGLWRNCYDANWLADLTPGQRCSLEIIEEEYVFDLPDVEAD